MDFKLTFVVALSLLVAFTDAVPFKTTLKVEPASYDVGNGGDFVFTCKKADTGDAPDKYLFKKGAADVVEDANNVVVAGVLTVKGTTAAVMGATEYTCAGKKATDTGPYSDAVTVEVKEIKAPKLTVAPTIADIAADTDVTFTCTKDTSNSAPKEYRFFKGTADITGTDKTATTLKYKIVKDDHEKEFHCQFYNSDTATGKADSTKLKATVKGGAAGGTGSGTEGIHMASLTTICLALVLSAIWKN